jgi:hypothetical protein
VNDIFQAAFLVKQIWGYSPSAGNTSNDGDKKNGAWGNEVADHTRTDTFPVFEDTEQELRYKFKLLGHGSSTASSTRANPSEDGDEVIEGYKTEDRLLQITVMLEAQIVKPETTRASKSVKEEHNSNTAEAHVALPRTPEDGLRRGLPSESKEAPALSVLTHTSPLALPPAQLLRGKPSSKSRLMSSAP